MAIAIRCECGSTYDLKDEFAGRVVQCPRCGQSLRAERAVPLAVLPQADAVFDRDRFLLRQKVISINEKYHVRDEQDRSLLFVERPAHVLMNALALLAAGLAFLTVFGALGAAGASLKGSPEQNPFIAGLWISGAVLGLAAAILVAILIHPKRNVTFWRDESRTEKLLEILQDQKFQLIHATYTILDPAGQAVARLHKNYLYNLIRKRWRCSDGNGTTLCVAKEDSIILSLLRRLLGHMLGLLRTNFIILHGESDHVIGEFNRKFTLVDRYVLDLSGDPTRTLDRRVALALGVMLDTGERR